MIIRFILFGMLGIVAMVLATAVKSSVVNRRLELVGEASLIHFPLFGIIALIYPIIAIRIGFLPWYGRGVVYMLAFYIVQYLMGLVLTKIGICPWSYSKGSFQGLIRIADAPVWYAAGLLVEWIYPYVKMTANALG